MLERLGEWYAFAHDRYCRRLTLYDSSVMWRGVSKIGLASKSNPRTGAHANDLKSSISTAEGQIEAARREPVTYPFHRSEAENGGEPEDLFDAAASSLLLRQSTRRNRGQGSAVSSSCPLSVAVVGRILRECGNSELAALYAPD